MAHLLISGAALLHNLLIDTAQKPRRIKLRETNARDARPRENPQAGPGG
ncbi:hypothetical protein KBY96_15825 [Cyanobium sp. ATX 6A2]|nr:hypothetical protein [Cyanobium sp. ATX 6A2]MCP9887834.1 hypothetical protein [Cyanobium sp. ATX 6A2]MCP9889384.1 hypothetical protein [Cyanobium sp. ATX 6A2]